MPTIDIGDDKHVRGFISEKGVADKKKIDFYLEVLTQDINSKYEFSILNNKNAAKIDILDKTKALQIVSDKLIFRGCVENVGDFIYEENNDLGIYLKNTISKDIYIKSKMSTSMKSSDLINVKHNCKVSFNTNKVESKITTAEKEITKDIDKKENTDVSNMTINKKPDTKKKDSIDYLSKDIRENKSNSDKECTEQKEVTVTLSETDKENCPTINNMKELDLLKNIPLKGQNKTYKDRSNYKLIQTRELLSLLSSKSITCKESRNNGRDTFAFKISYFNFKKVSLYENVYYTPIDLIVTMFKNQIMHFGKFMICIILKKNSNYIKNIQIGIPSDTNMIKLDGLNDCKFFLNKEEGVGYWLINYEP